MVLYAELKNSGGAYSVITRIGNGRKSFSQLKACLEDEESRNSLDYTLEQLQKSDFIEKKQPINIKDSRRKRFYELKSNMLRFHLSYIEKNPDAIATPAFLEKYIMPSINTFVSYNLRKNYDTTEIHVDVNIVSNDVLDIDKFRNWRPEFKDAEFILEDGKYICGWAIEKMSKSMFNVVNPDDIVETYGADTLRLYEMFLGPLEQSKPWDTNGIDGVNRFIKKLWNLFYAKGGDLNVSDDKPSAEALKSLHKLIKKVTWDIEHFSYNTSISAFMICVNELTALKCNSREILSDLVVLIAPFAPHIAEELWHTLGNETTVCDAKWPVYNEAYLVESTVTYAVSFNGKTRFSMQVPNGTAKEEVEKLALNNPNSEKWIEGKTPKKVIVVPNKIVNIVI